MPIHGMRLQRIEVAGVRGAFAAAGAGPALVLVPSPLVLARTYRDTIPPLARAFRVTVIELPGSGRGTHLAAPWSAEQYADWLAGALAFLRIERPTVVGHSNSGAVALLMAARHPDRVGHLILADTVGGEPRPLAALVGGWVLDMLHESRLALTRWHHVAANLVGHPRNFLQLVRMAATIDLRAEAARVRAPTLLAWAAHDRTAPVRAARALADRLPAGALYLSQRGGHDWILDRPAEFTAAVRRFTRRAG
jgi:pimeloyl-ACP methyl ester carboxylesterase